VLRNSLAHLIARLAGLGAGIVTIPLVTLTLGTEALGLVGVYATLQAMLGLFDLGLPMAANHRLAVLIGRNAAPAERAVLVRTLETLFWVLVALFLVIGFGLRGPLAESWLNVTVLPRATVDTALGVMIVVVAVRFPVAFYTNVLFAHDRHVYPNVVTATSAVLRIGLSVAALVWFNVGIVGFFIIQLIGGVAEVVLLAGGVWRVQSHRWASPRWTVLRDIGAMAGGLTLVSLTAVVLSQIDKIILSKLLSLGDFGLYSAGYTLAAGLVALSYPVGNAVFPELARGFDAVRSALRRLVDGAVELTILAIVPLGCVMVMQSEALLRLLFLIKPVPDGLGGTLSLMTLGGIAQAFVTLPHLFQVAAGRVAIVASINLAFIVPYGMAVYLVGALGVLAPAIVFAVFNIARLAVHWGVLLMGGARATWQPAVGMSLAAVAGGLAVAAVPAAASLSGPAALAAAILSVPLLTLAAAALLPRSRERLSALLGLHAPDKSSGH
jgi:O-antigen/teichoic acid export membrane protein